MYKKDELVYFFRGKGIRIPLYTESLSHKNSESSFTCIPMGRDLQMDKRRNYPGYFPYTLAGLFPLKRTDEDPTRSAFGGRKGDPAKDLISVSSFFSGSYESKEAFDSVRFCNIVRLPDPDLRPDIGTVVFGRTRMHV